jgi:predicted DNA-binding transcriptional regulator AlpA
MKATCVPKVSPASEKVLRPDEIAKRAKCSSRNIFRLWARGEGPRRVLVSERCVGSLESDVDDWLRSRREPERRATPAKTDAAAGIAA